MLHNYLKEVKQNFSWRYISQSEIRNSAAAKARAGREFLSPSTPFLPAPPERSVWRAKRGGQFRSKKVRISSNKRTSIKLSGILPTDFAARSAERYGNTGSPRRARLAKRRFEIPCDFKYLLCPIKN